MTGETANGRSISVTSRLLPRKSNLAIAQAAATPKTGLSGTAIAATSRVSRTARQGVRLAGWRRGRPPRPSRRPRAKTATSGSSRNSARKTSATAIRVQRTAGGSPVARGRRGRVAGRETAMVAMLRPRTRRRAAPALEQVDHQEQHERDDQHDHADRRGAGVVELLQLGDDQQRRDLGLHRHVAGDEDHRAVLAERPGEGQREAGEQRRQQRRQDDPPEGLPAAGAEGRGGLFDLRLEVAAAPAGPCGPRTAGR